MSTATRPKREQGDSVNSGNKADSGFSFQVRNIEFKVNDAIPRHWHGGRAAITAFFDNLSVFFPHGESFFVRSVKRFRKLAKDDPQLEKDVEEFCAQEGVHSREHRRYNKLLQEKGYPVEEMEERVRQRLLKVREGIPPRGQLAVTVALEHFTALMAHAILSDDATMEGSHPVMRDLWLWHAAEENEHKAVAFDLWKKAGGRYWERAVVMVGATVIFWSKVIDHQVRMMRVDETLNDPKEWASLLWYLFGSPGGLRILIPHWFDYFRPDFHPWDLDNRDVLERWQQYFAESDTYEHA